MTKEEMRINWRNRWLNSIRELTDIKLQTDSWIDKTNTNPHWSFVEFMSCYFDDLNLDENYVAEIKDKYITETEYDVIKHWHKRLRNYKSPIGADYNHGKILVDIKWQNIVSMGFSAKNELSKLLNNLEFEILNRNLGYAEIIANHLKHEY